MKKTAVSLLALLAAGPQPLLAQDIALDEIVVSANLGETEAGRTGATVEVVTTEDLRSTGDLRFSDVLRRLPGVSVNTRGGMGSQTGIAIRGASQNYVGVLVDGIDVTDPTATQVAFDFGQLTTSDVSRVEVLKGSQSALYGSGAVGGVVTITTLRPTEEGTHQSVSAEIGSHRTAALSYGITHLSDNSEAALTLSHVETDGFSNASEADGNTEADGYELDRLSFHVARTLQNGVRIGLNGFTEKSESEYDPAYYMPSDTLGRVLTHDQWLNAVTPIGDGESYDEKLDRESVGLRAFAEFKTGAFSHTASASVFRSKRRYFENEVGYFTLDDNGTENDPTDDLYGTFTSLSDNRYEGRREKLDWRAAVAVADGELVFGADWQREDFDQSGTWGELSEDSSSTGLYGEFTRRIGDLDLALSLRRDDHSIFGTFDAARVALAYHVDEATILRAQFGNGYRAPSNFELFSFFGSQDLKPEQSRNIDIGVEHEFASGTSVRATAFYLEVDDLIDYNRDATGCPAAALYGPGCYAQVPGTSRRSGLELSGELALTDTLGLAAAYTYTDSATNAATTWASVPRHLVAVELTSDLTPTLHGRIGLTAAMDRPDDFGTPVENYSLVDATLTKGLGEGREAYLRVENLFDEEYELVPGYGTSGRAVFAGLRARF
ncbi:TonB-dependent receptor plug domain-containing protein [Cereibacter azotoformans]|uniref:TonB-dependent receptor plug domain-containing protein n=1 Tax=Cereibacter azotoformans TaxID=43057 RepID=UPI000C6EC357|nr:TonB-dependent receptor [Cereibacter azotoformans]